MPKRRESRCQMAMEPVTGACVFISWVNVVFIFTGTINLIRGGLSKQIFAIFCFRLVLNSVH